MLHHAPQYSSGFKDIGQPAAASQHRANASVVSDGFEDAAIWDSPAAAEPQLFSTEEAHAVAGSYAEAEPPAAPAPLQQPAQAAPRTRSPTRPKFDPRAAAGGFEDGFDEASFGDSTSPRDGGNPFGDGGGSPPAQPAPQRQPPGTDLGYMSSGSWDSAASPRAGGARSPRSRDVSPTAAAAQSNSGSIFASAYQVTLECRSLGMLHQKQASFQFGVRALWQLCMSEHLMKPCDCQFLRPVATP